MRKLNRLLTGVIIVTALAITAPAMAAVNMQDNFQPASLERVDAVSIDGSGTATITIGAPAQMVISGPDAAMDAMRIVATNDELEIEPIDGTAAPAAGEQVHYAITLPRLEDLRLRGSIQLDASGIQGDELDVRLEGSSTAVLTDLEVDEFDVRLEGSSLLTTTGSVNELDLELHESSTFEGSGLATGSADIDANDAAMAVVQVSGRLEVEVHAAAIVEYIGEPASTDFEMNEAGIVRPYSGDAATPDASPAASPAETAATQVSMAGRVFTPATIEIAAGQQVTWINDDDADHTVSASDRSFDSGTIPEGASFTFTFEEAGEFPYFCAFHPEMQGTVTVT